jgi:Flp pilus assembly protein protease CpaA
MIIQRFFNLIECSCGYHVADYCCNFFAMEKFIIFMLGLGFMLAFSYQDLKHSEIENKPILVFLILGVIISIWTNKVFTLLPFCLFWMLLGGLLWKFNSIGGADVKILTVLPIFYLITTPNFVSGQFIFIMVFGITGVLYGVLAKLIIKTKKEIPFLPIITLSYIISFLFWTIN